MKIKIFIPILFISSLLFAQPNLTVDSIVVKTSNDTVYVWDYNAWEQCGFQLDYKVEFVDSVITITQIDTAGDMTTCYSYHNFVVPIVNLPFGSYRIDIYRDCLFADIRFIKSFWFQYPLSSMNNLDDQPDKFILYNAYPNPFNPVTNISYSIPAYGFVSLVIYNSLGQKVVDLVSMYQHAGTYNANFNADNLSSGIYYYKLQYNNYISTKKVLLLK